MKLPCRELRALAIMLATLGGVTATFRAVGLRWQHTESLPRGLYRVDQGAPIRRGSVVLWCLDPIRGRWARDRRYLMRGDCPGEVEPLGKMVLAVGGDTVDWTSEGVRIGGRWIPRTRPIHADQVGRPLVAVSYRRYVLASGAALALLTHFESLARLSILRPCTSSVGPIGGRAALLMGTIMEYPVAVSEHRIAPKIYGSSQGPDLLGDLRVRTRLGLPPSGAPAAFCRRVDLQTSRQQRGSRPEWRRALRTAGPLRPQWRGGGCGDMPRLRPCWTSAHRRPCKKRDGRHRLVRLVLSGVGVGPNAAGRSARACAASRLVVGRLPPVS